MIILRIIPEDLTNYKKTSMFIAMPTCTFKCEKESGVQMCQNRELATSPKIVIKTSEIITQYLANPLTSAVVFGGLEPFDSYRELSEFIYLLRNDYDCYDDVVIYTGYTEDECKVYIERLLEKIGWSACRNIIIKYGRYIPNQESHYDELLGVNLISDNQYAKKIIDK